MKQDIIDFTPAEDNYVTPVMRELIIRFGWMYDFELRNMNCVTGDEGKTVSLVLAAVHHRGDPAGNGPQFHDLSTFAAGMVTGMKVSAKSL